MEANQAPLEKAMAKKSLVEARKVLGEVCTTKPSPFDSKYDGYGYAHVQTNAECVNDVLVCGEDEALLSRATRKPPLKDRTRDRANALIAHLPGHGCPTG